MSSYEIVMKVEQLLGCFMSCQRLGQAEKANSNKKENVMKNKITGRVSRIISGGFNALLDAVENAAPEAVMEQAMREIDEAIEEVRAELSQVIANKHLANSRLTQVHNKCKDLEEKIELALTSDRDDLAEAAISQQLDMEPQIPILEAQISELSAEEQKLEGYIAALQGKKREMKEEIRLYRASRAELTGISGTEASTATNAIEQKVSKAETAFERVLENTVGVGMPGGASDRKTAAALSELEDLARKNRVQERLEAVKGKRGAKV